MFPRAALTREAVMLLFMRMVTTAGVVSCALVTSAHATCGTRGGPGFRAPDGRCVGWNDIGRTCGSPPTQRCTAEATNAGAEDAAKQGVEALQTKKPKKAAQPQ